MLVSTIVYADICENISAGKKIAAIKLLRKETHTGLKEAKDAVERLAHKSGHGHFPHAHEHGALIVATPIIKKITVNVGDGDVEVDLDGMELIALTAMQRIGLEECGRILDLVQALKAFSSGKNIGVLE
jgi:hypothetical protein